jgi:hypothetical protein
MKFIGRAEYIPILGLITTCFIKNVKDLSFTTDLISNPNGIKKPRPDDQDGVLSIN